MGISLKTKPRMLGTVLAFRIKIGKGRNALRTAACFKLYACQLNNFKNDFVCYIPNFGNLTMLYIIQFQSTNNSSQVENLEINIYYFNRSNNYNLEKIEIFSFGRKTTLYNL